MRPLSKCDGFLAVQVFVRRVRVRAARGGTDFHVLARIRNWVHVRFEEHFDVGVFVVSGWIWIADMDAVPRGADGFTGRSANVARLRAEMDDFADLRYRGVALIRTGTPVLFAARGTEWARVHELCEWIVRAPPGAEWVQILAIPGVKNTQSSNVPFENAWVHRSNVTFVGSPFRDEASAPSSEGYLRGRGTSPGLDAPA